jgi:hypothetical protein
MLKLPYTYDKSRFFENSNIVFEVLFFDYNLSLGKYLKVNVFDESLLNFLNPWSYYGFDSFLPIWVPFLRSLNAHVGSPDSSR